MEKGQQMKYSEVKSCSLVGEREKESDPRPILKKERKTKMLGPIFVTCSLFDCSAPLIKYFFGQFYSLWFFHDDLEGEEEKRFTSLRSKIYTSCWTDP